MDYKFAQPSVILARYIKNYWAMEIDVQTQNAYHHRIIPTGLTDLTFFFGNAPKSTSEKNSIAEGAILSGQQKSFYDLKIENSFRLISVVFTPEGMNRFLSIPSKEFKDLSLKLNDTLINGVDKLTEMLYKKTFEASVSALNSFFEDRLVEGINETIAMRLNHTVNLISSKYGQVRTLELADEVCLSRKQFERLFINHIGSSPKQYLKTIRFQNALFQKSKNPKISLTDLAYACGYFDQSHMINDFKSLTGDSPSKFFKDCEPFSDYFENPM